MKTENNSKPITSQMLLMIVREWFLESLIPADLNEEARKILLNKINSNYFTNETEIKEIEVLNDQILKGIFEYLPKNAKSACDNLSKRLEQIGFPELPSGKTSISETLENLQAAKSLFNSRFNNDMNAINLAHGIREILADLKQFGQTKGFQADKTLVNTFRIIKRGSAWGGKKPHSHSNWGQNHPLGNNRKDKDDGGIY